MRIIKEMLGSVASGTPCIWPSQSLPLFKINFTRNKPPQIIFADYKITNLKVKCTVHRQMCRFADISKSFADMLIGCTWTLPQVTSTGAGMIASLDRTALLRTV